MCIRDRKEAGVMDVRVVTDPTDSSKYRAYYTDHFAGLVVASGAEDPATKWKNGGGSYNNDTDAKVYWPDYEFVKSYDMTPVVVGDESMPAFLVATDAKMRAAIHITATPANTTSHFLDSTRRPMKPIARKKPSQLLREKVRNKANKLMPSNTIR